MTTIQQVSRRIRAIRTSRGLSLRDVQEQSDQVIRAVVLSSYERGDRALSVKTAITLANFYGVPLGFLLEQPDVPQGTPIGIVFDLRKLGQILSHSERMAKADVNLQNVIRFISSLVGLRNDWNGEVLSIRSSDLSMLALISGKSCDEIVQILTDNQILLRV